MTTNDFFLKRHPILTYYVLTFVISWGGVLFAAGGPGGFPANPEEAQNLLPLIVLSLVAGPFIVGIALTGILFGKDGLREFVSRLFRWRVSIRWYAVALLTAPLAVLVAQLALSRISTDFLPGIFTAKDVGDILLSGLMAGLAGGLLEEPGWTGFVTPRIKPRYSIFLTGIIIGLLWGAWHFIAALWGSGDPAGLFDATSFLSQVIFYVGVLPAYRILMVWVYDHTDSLLIAMLMHGSLTAFTTFIFSPDIAVMGRLTYHLALTVTMWVIIAVVAYAGGRQIAQRPVRRRVA